MKEKELTCTKMVKIINIYLITLFFTQSLLNIIKNTSSSSFSLFFYNKKVQTYFLSILYYIKNTKYLYF